MALVVKNLPSNAGDVRDTVSIPGLGRSPGVGPSSSLQYSCLEKPMDRGTWWVTESDKTEVTQHAHKWYSDQNGFNAFWSWFGLKYFHQDIIPRWLLAGGGVACHSVCGISVPQPQTEPISLLPYPRQWKPRVLTSRQWGNSPTWLFYLTFELVKGVLLDFQIFEFFQIYY